MSAGRSPAGPDGSVLLAWVIPGAAALAALAATFLWMAEAVDALRTDRPWPAGPLEVGRAVALEGAPLPSVLALAVAAVLVAVSVTLLVLVVARLTRGLRHRPDVDRSTRHLAKAPERQRLGHRARTAEATRLAPSLKNAPGLLIGRTVNGGQRVYQGWEDVALDVWGPRRGKTTSRAVPALLAAPGAAVATSNKRDLLDTTAGLRSQTGRVWVFDPQGIASDGTPTFVYDPLSRVRTAVQAQRLAALFVADTKEPGARTDPQWDTAGADLLAWLMLAAAVDGRPLGDVWAWVSDSSDDTPVRLLREHGHEGPAASVDGVAHQPDKMRGSVYGTAQRMARPLINPQLLAWVTPTPGLPTFDPTAFVGSNGVNGSNGPRDTLYALSREGAGSSGAVVTALTSAICEDAERAAMTNPDRSGRLPTPLVVVLDEAANVCRWPELPALYSHYGSRGIALLTFLQSYSQGVAVWGEEGMRTLWSAATVRVYGGGVADQRWLAELSDLIGDHDEIHRSVSTSRHGRSTSIDTRQRRTMTTAELTALPTKRAVVLAGGRPLLVEPMRWFEDKRQAETITAAAKEWEATHA
ncbi:type IV secretory system conjugative DNA transfer family protein [uncultured Pseudokineococcus sp.]|uniref:type IV secretory system conjugative DNA transfer family protein n=1 Tax=uncultured Pseudokineococcus sp. TaxID=1642928 RepID=UPI00262DC9BA|nr:TraM recognition domain-containing protein [uncultured Pseudokineococcus sp.]